MPEHIPFIKREIYIISLQIADALWQQTGSEAGTGGRPSYLARSLHRLGRDNGAKNDRNISFIPFILYLQSNFIQNN